ncbi:hypothetical protein JCM8547_000908 [Rhodosporidiobolus lusitaniae]
MLTDRSTARLFLPAFVVSRQQKGSFGWSGTGQLEVTFGFKGGYDFEWLPVSVKCELKVCKKDDPSLPEPALNTDGEEARGEAARSVQRYTAEDWTGDDFDIGDSFVKVEEEEQPKKKKAKTTKGKVAASRKAAGKKGAGGKKDDAEYGWAAAL